MAMHLFGCSSVLTSRTHSYKTNQAQTKPLVTPCGRNNLENVVLALQPIPESSEPIANLIGWRGSSLTTPNKDAYIRPGELKVSHGVICDTL